MAKNDNLNDFLADVANAIRLKKGTSDLINPQDFSDEIASIEGGGSGGGDSSIEYLDLSGVDYMIDGQIPLKSFVALMGYTMKFVNPNNDVLIIACCSSLFSSFSATAIQSLDYRAVEINFNGIYGGNPSTGITTTNDILLQSGVPQSELDSIPRLTKEQFYSLE